MSGYDAQSWANKQRAGNGNNKAILMYLAGRADESYSCYPSIATMVRDTEFSESTVRRAIVELVEAGLLRQLYRYHSTGGRRSCRYLLLVRGPETPLPDNDWIYERQSSRVGAPCQAEGGDPVTRTGGVLSDRPVSPLTNPQIEPPGRTLPRKAASRPSREVVKVNEETAQTILKAWLDFSGRPNLGALTARWGQAIKAALKHFTADKIKWALSKITQRREFSYPGKLHVYLVEMQTGPAVSRSANVNPRAEKNQRTHDLIEKFQAAERAAGLKPTPPTRQAIGPRPPAPPQIGAVHAALGSC